MPRDIDEHYLGEWMSLGMAQLDSLLDAHAQFHAWLAEHRPDLLPCGRRCRMRRTCRAHAAAGWSVGDIATATGWSVHQVRDWTQRRATPEVRAEALRLREAGMSFAAIAREVGFSKATVRQWLVPGAARRRKMRDE